MTTGQGGKVHFDDAADLSRGVRLMQPMRRDERILKAQRERDTLAVAGSAKRHPVAADRHISRPVHQEIQSPNPSVYNCHAVPRLGRRLARNGQNVAVVTGSTLKSLEIAHTGRRGFVPLCLNLFSDCSGLASSLTAPIEPVRSNSPKPTGQLVTASRSTQSQPGAPAGDLLRPS